MNKITINPSFFIDTDSDDSAIGHDWALEALTSVSDGKKSQQEAARVFVETMMEFVFAEPRSVAPTLYGAISLFLEVAHVKTGVKS